MATRVHQTFGSLAAAILEHGETIQREVQRIKVEGMTVIMESVIASTPVDTGRARSNWRAKVGGPPLTTINPWAPGSRLGRGESANRDAATRAARAVFAGSQPSTALYLSNGVKYIQKLDEGHSKQTPAGFVAVAFTQGVNNIRRARIRL